jgi:hypothetical protein
MCKQLKFMDSSVCDVTLCNVLNSYRRFGGAVFVNLQCLAVQDVLSVDTIDVASQKISFRRRLLENLRTRIS